MRIEIRTDEGELLSEGEYGEEALELIARKNDRMGLIPVNQQSETFDYCDALATQIQTALEDG